MAQIQPHSPSKDQGDNIARCQAPRRAIKQPTFYHKISGDAFGPSPNSAHEEGERRPPPRDRPPYDLPVHPKIPPTPPSPLPRPYCPPAWGCPPPTSQSARKFLLLLPVHSRALIVLQHGGYLPVRPKIPPTPPSPLPRSYWTPAWGF